MSAPAVHELFVELLHEELPAVMIEPALAGLRDALVALLGPIPHGAVRTFATPRRLAVAIADVAEGTPPVERLVTGPPAERAFAEGKPTGVAVGFAKGRGVPVESLEIVDGPKGPVVAARVVEGGRLTEEVLRDGLDALVRGLPFKKSMEWGTGGVRFGRPLHAVSVLFGGRVIEAEVAGVRVGRSTRGHRLAADTAFSFTDSASWLEGLRQRAVIADVAERRARIQAGLDELTDALGADRIDDPALLDEVQHLVEVPVVMEGAFDEELLDLPPRLLVTSMKVHQRYFPIFESGLLTNRFAIVSNNPWADAALVAEGNARVLRARFHDARFFLAEDRKRPLDAFTAALSKMRWINGLGTMADKQVRVSALAPALVVRLAGEAEEVAALAGIAGRAGMLCKADLATQMVGEFPELQGHMGRLYAAHAGEGDAVARAIEDHYRPAFAGDAVPTALPSVALALADRLDTLVGCFGIGMVPKGSGDPQGLRRAAAGVLALLQDNGLRVPLPDLFRRAIEVFQFTLVDSVLPRGDRLAFDAWIAARGEGPHARDMDALVDELVAFTVARFKAAAVADGATADRVDAVLAVSEADPILLRARLDALERVAGTDAFAPILNTFKRVLNISAGQHAPAPDPSSMTEPAERDLAHAVAAARDEVSRASARLDFDAALAAMLRLEQPIAAFFDAVLVDDPDPARKAVRVGLLLEVASLFHTVADFTRVSSR